MACASQSGHVARPPQGCSQALRHTLPVPVTDRLARFARVLASFASYADPLLGHTEIVSWGPEKYSDLGKAETS